MNAGFSSCLAGAAVVNAVDAFLLRGDNVLGAVALGTTAIAAGFGASKNKKVIKEIGSMYKSTAFPHAFSATYYAAKEAAELFKQKLSRVGLSSFFTGAAAVRAVDAFANGDYGFGAAALGYGALQAGYAVSVSMKGIKEIGDTANKIDHER